MTKFTVEDEVTEVAAVRTTADRISTEGRRCRREFNGTTQHLGLDPRVVAELSQEGHLCWCNDDQKGNLQYLESIGYRFITNREAYGERDNMSPDDRAKVRYGTCDDKGTAQDIYLMSQPWDFYNEDQEAMANQQAGMDKTIMAGGKEIDKHYGRKIEYQTNQS